jgi:hypothetical protein
MSTRGISRHLDIACGVCFCHETPISTCGILLSSQQQTFVNKRPAIRCLDVTITFCGHISIVSTCSNLSSVKKRGISRTDDLVTGCMIGIITTGSTNVKTK